MYDSSLNSASLTIGEGFVGGIAFAIAIKHGVPIDEGGMSLFSAKKILEAFKQVSPNVDLSSAELILFFAGIALFIASIVAVIVSITRMDNWITGAVLYSLGFIFGAIIIL
ncbi:hypothetical protein [Methanomethylovorans sp.]|uniref:hypothetical protein n=1 Tax=Methanomethylovorans sp. TaxID=2758717 RepID=UPI00351C3C37